jgi:hypothetical protein
MNLTFREVEPQSAAKFMPNDQLLFTIKQLIELWRPQNVLAPARPLDVALEQTIRELLGELCARAKERAS